MRDPSSPVAAGVLFPELLGASDPAPPMRSRGSRVLRVLARTVLWTLIAAGAFRGLLPVPHDPSPAGRWDDRRGEAVAAAFLREYLTVGGDRAARAERLGQFAVAGADLPAAVAVPAGVAQYVDQVVPGGSAPIAGGVEVTVLAHVLQVRSGSYRDAGTLAFVVPLAVQGERVAVRAPPRPTALPTAPNLRRPRASEVPSALARAAGRMARQAVDAWAAADVTTLARLGGGRPPATRPLPPGWHVADVGDADVTGPAGAPTAQVEVRVRPPAGSAIYVIPVRVELVASAGGLNVRRINAGSG
jgi:hypothetical protein